MDAHHTRRSWLMIFEEEEEEWIDEEWPEDEYED